MDFRSVARRHYPLLFIIAFLVTACVSIPESKPPTTPSLVSPVASEDDWLKIYFTEPGSPAAEEFQGGADKAMAEAIDAARLTVDAAMYSMNLWSIRNALIRAHNRGVTVRVVTDSDNLGGEEFQDLIDAGIPVIGDRHESLMHNKFLVIDHLEVWTGSMNFTLNAVYEDNNNLICLRSGDIAEDYLVEFNEMFVEDHFGADILARTPHPLVSIGDRQVEILFSPDDGVQSRLVDLLDNAQESIYFMAFSFTADALGDSIRARAEAGVMVLGVMDHEQALSNEGTEFDPFLESGLDVRVDGNHGQMHHKVIIIDETIVITGSYNFSASAEERNDENVVIIHDRATALTFSNEFWRILNQAIRP